MRIHALNFLLLELFALFGRFALTNVVFLEAAVGFLLQQLYLLMSPRNRVTLVFLVQQRILVFRPYLPNYWLYYRLQCLVFVFDVGLGRFFLKMLLKLTSQARLVHDYLVVRWDY